MEALYRYLVKKLLVLLNFVSGLWQYNRNNVEVGAIRKVGYLPRNVSLNVTFATNIFAPFDMQKNFYNTTAKSLNTKKIIADFSQ